MIPPIVGGLIALLGPELTVSIWDGEVPRTDNQGLPIKPGASQVPSSWPVVKLFIEEPGFTTHWNFEDPYYDDGTIKVEVWSTGRSPTESLMSDIMEFFAASSNWPLVDLDLDPNNPVEDNNPAFIIKLLMSGWWSGQDKTERTAQGQLLYRGDLYYKASVHNAVSTN